MNERIKELAVQAGAGEWGDSVIAATMDIEKFAELIVLECAELADKESSKPCESYDELIKQHFGVE
jgi:predicted alternative tryptophan synthase beta-subunit